MIGIEGGHQVGSKITWKLKFKGHELVVEDLIEPAVGVVEWAKDYVGTALETSPTGSIVWAGVCLLLPLVLNPSKQAASHVKGLDTISSILSQCHIREELYRRRYESKVVHGIEQNPPSSHMAYCDALKALYVELLTFQATFVQFLSKHMVIKVAGNMVKWQTWDAIIPLPRTDEDAGGN
ncbi:hypothetical protein BDZ45DRAFT_692165 [Acephala macrosclerotiorum]|nr:hypothetical protein BDZ45DRAFT_692165 [Acephala macrosclerotiorum]